MGMADLTYGICARSTDAELLEPSALDRPLLAIMLMDMVLIERVLPSTTDLSSVSGWCESGCVCVRERESVIVSVCVCVCVCE